MPIFQKFSATWVLGCLALCQSYLAAATDESSIALQDHWELSAYSHHVIASILPLIQEWTETEFIQYPYFRSLAQGEIFPLFALLADEPLSLVTLVKAQDKVIGIAGGVVLDCVSLQSFFEQSLMPTSLSFAQRLQMQGFDPSRIFYMAFFLTAPEYRNDTNLIALMYNQFNAFAYQLDRDQICFFESVGDPMRKPENFTPIQPWNGVIKQCRSMGVEWDMYWPTLQLDGSIKQQAHTLEFFVKELEN